MATHRYISTTFWDDAWIQGLGQEEKFTYLYLMTNPLTGISGIYKITNRRISFDTGIHEDRIKEILAEFGAARKAIRMNEYIVLPSWPKHQEWEKSPNIKKGIINELNHLKDDELLFVYNCAYKFPMQDLLTTRKIKVNNETEKEQEPDTQPLPTNSTDNIPDTLYTDTKGIDTPPNGMQGVPTILFNSNSDLNLSNFIGNSNADAENPVVDNLEKKRPPPKELYIFIREKVKAYGFYIDEPVAKKIAASIQNPDWFTAKHSILDLVLEKISSIYASKPKEEQKKLFVSALTQWDNIKDEYPDWLNKKIAVYKKSALEKLRNSPPLLCPHCQTDMGGNRRCPKCKGNVIFNEDTVNWQYEKLPDFSFSEGFAHIMKSHREDKKQTSPPQEEDIDF